MKNFLSFIKKLINTKLITLLNKYKTLKMKLSLSKLIIKKRKNKRETKSNKVKI